MQLMLDIYKAIIQRASNPLPHSVMLSLLKDYKRPNEKIHELIKANVLTPVKKGLYIAGPALGSGKPEPYLLANVIYGPSYVSVETALSFHGLIPEKVYEVASMTTKPSRQFSTAAGHFTYTRLPIPYYSFGIDQIRFPGSQAALMASPEKALCDKIVTSPSVILRSRSQAQSFLVENLRMDTSRLAALSIDLIGTWVKQAPKQKSLEILMDFLKRL